MYHFIVTSPVYMYNSTYITNTQSRRPPLTHVQHCIFINVRYLSALRLSNSCIAESWIKRKTKHNKYHLTMGAPNVMIDIHLKLPGGCLKVHTVSLNLQTKQSKLPSLQSRSRSFWLKNTFNILQKLNVQVAFNKLFRMKLTWMLSSMFRKCLVASHINIYSYLPTNRHIGVRSL